MTADPRAWVGRFEEREDVAEPGPVRRLAALLDHATPPWAAGIMPPLGHWLYFLPEARQSAIGADGHPRAGGFLPPIDLPRRMWAGGRIEFRAPITLGATMTRRSTVADVVAKTGASGAMAFVTIRREIIVEGMTALVEEQDIVYRAAASPPAAPRSAPGGAEPEWRRSIALDAVALFRYSALTFNGHRIHYDRDYARHQENYPGLVVHGPYIATLLVDNLLRWRPRTPIAKLTYRARSPLFEGCRFDLCADPTENGARLWAQEPGRPIAMEAEATVSPASPT